MLQIQNVAMKRVDAPRNVGLGKQARPRRGLERVTCHAGPEFLQPDRQPAALEPGVAGDEDAAICPEGRLHPCLRSGPKGREKALYPGSQNAATALRAAGCGTWLDS